MGLNLVFIGAGNLATQLSKALQNRGFPISQVYSRTEQSAKSLACLLSTEYTTATNEIYADADVYFVALKDSAFDEILSKINFKNKLIVHCSGSLPLNVLEKYSSNTGVFYPLQTFSKSRNIDFSEIPVFIESGNQANEKTLREIAGKISEKVSILDSEKRRNLHISAVFACNFVNYFYTVASQILKSKEIQFDVLKPLIIETASKILDMEPEKAQTGPAVRFDKNIIKCHLKELNEFPNFRKLYKSISKSIFDHYNN